MIFYKETEFQDSSIGIIPKDWEVTNISGASLLVTDGSHFSPKHQSSGYPLATVANMRENDIDVNSCYRITKEDYEKLVATGDKPEVNDVLFSKDGTVGQCIVFNQKVDLIVLSSIAIIRPNLKKINPYFLKYMLQSPAALDRIIGSKTGSAIKRIILRDLNSIKIALPNKLEEQKNIVEVLTIVDSAIELADKVIAKTERLKKGLMQHLLTRGIGHTEYKDTPIGKIPKEWELKTLLDAVGGKKDLIIAGPFGSNLKVCDYRDNGVPIIRLQNIEYGRFINKNTMFISPEKAEELSYHSFVEGDIVLAKLGDPIGKTCIVPDFLKKGIVVADVVRIRANEKFLNKKYAMYVLNSFYVSNQLNRETIGTTRPRVNLDQVRNLLVPFPSLPEQKQVADTLSTVDEKLEFERNEKAKLVKIKQGLMDLLLNGKVRIKVD